MSKPSKDSQPTGFSAVPVDRLESWKEIATYLKRSVRTVQRWEREEGLPVHRHQHVKGGTPYALTAELDRWRASRNEQQAKARDEPLESKHPARLRWTAAAVLLAVMILVTVWLIPPEPAADHGMERSEPQWILIADFDNRTGDELFDGSVEAVLKRELANSTRAYVVPRSRVSEVLELMTRSPETRIDAALAQEIAVRDGDIDTLITGDVGRIGSDYVVNVEIRVAEDGQMIRTLTGESNEDMMPRLLQTLSDQVRESLGERLQVAEGSGTRLERATTPSLRALKLYSEAYLAVRRDGNWPAAERLTREALAEDPEFALAHNWLAWGLRNQGHPPEAFLPPSQRAYELADRASDREKWFIIGTYHHFNGNRDEAIAAYETLVHLHPDHHYGVNNLVLGFYPAERRYSDMAQLVLRRADLRPNHLGSQTMAMQYAGYKGDIDVARRYYERARALMDGPPEPPQHRGLAWFPVFEHWVRGDARAGLTGLQRLDKRFGSNLLDQPSGSVPADWRAAQDLGSWYLAFGRLDDAEQSYRRVSDPVCDACWERDANDLARAQVAVAREDWSAVRRHVERYLSWAGPSTALFARYRDHRSFATWFLVRAGLTAEAERTFGALKPNEPFSVNRQLGRDLMKAELALARGAPQEVVALIEPGAHSYVGDPRFFQNIGTAAEAWELLDDPNAAIRVLEQNGAARMLTWGQHGSVAVFWLRNQWHLAKLYRKLGQDADAIEIEDDLRRILAEADDDHPIVVGLKRLAGSSTS